MATAGNEYSVTIPPQALDVHIKMRDATSKLKIYTTSVGNTTPSNYYTVNAGATLEFRTKLGGQTIYLQSDGTSVVAEVSYVIDP
jgi:hypothetical protein